MVSQNLFPFLRDFGFGFRVLFFCDVLKMQIRSFLAPMAAASFCPERQKIKRTAGHNFILETAFSASKILNSFAQYKVLVIFTAWK